MLALLTVLALGACGSGGKKGSTATGAQRTTPTTAPAGAVAAPRCARVKAPKPRPQKVPKPTLKLDPAKTYNAVVSTSCGDFTIALDVKDSPKTTSSFAYLARRGFYDNTTFHRIVPMFVIQGGDPLGNGTGGPGYKVIEPPPPGTRYTRGVVAMAKTETENPGTSGSQFYVVTGEDAQLPPDYALLGRVTAGMAVVDTIESVPTNPGISDPRLADRPLSPVVVNRITVP